MALDTTSFLLGKKAGGGGSTADYTALSNKPKINNIELNGNKTNIDLGIKDADVNVLPENVYFNEIKPGVYFSNCGSASFYENREATKFCTLSNINYLVIYKTLDSTIENNETFALCYYFGNLKDGILSTIFYLSNNTLSRTNTTLTYTISTNQNSILEIPGRIGFKKIPYFASSSIVPTQDTDIVNKKYVDDNAGGGDSTFYYTNDQYFDIDVSDLKLGTYIHLNSSYPKVRVTGLDGTTQNIDSSGILYIGKKYEDCQLNEPFAMILQGNFSVTRLYKENNAKGYDSGTSPTTFSAALPDAIMTQIKWSIPGFSYSGTQVLKNVNGSLSWVDE